MSLHSQLYCFTLQPILSIRLKKSVCWLVYDMQGSHKSPIRSWWMDKVWTVLLAVAWQNTLEHPSTRLLSSFLFSYLVSKLCSIVFRLWSQGLGCTVAQSSQPPGPLRMQRKRKMMKNKRFDTHYIQSQIKAIWSVFWNQEFHTWVDATKQR